MATMRVLWEIDVEVPDDLLPPQQEVEAAKLAKSLQGEGTTANVFLVAPFDHVEDHDLIDRSHWTYVDLDELEEED